MCKYDKNVILVYVLITFFVIIGISIFMFGLCVYLRYRIIYDTIQKKANLNIIDNIEIIKGKS